MCGTSPGLTKTVCLYKLTGRGLVLGHLDLDEALAHLLAGHLGLQQAQLDALPLAGFDPVVAVAVPEDTLHVHALWLLARLQVVGAALTQA